MGKRGLDALYGRLEEIQAIGRRLQELRQEERSLAARLLALGSEPVADQPRRRLADREDFLRIARTWRDGLHIPAEEAVALTREQLWDLPAEDMAWVIRELA